MPLQTRQFIALFGKNVKLLCSRRSILGTLFTSIVIPVAISLLLAVLVFLFFPKATFGVGSPHPVRNVLDAMNAKPGILVLVNNGSSVGGSIDKVIYQVAKPLLDAKKEVLITNSTDKLSSTCSVNYQGQTPCFAAVVFQSSTTEGPGGKWNYVLRNAFDLGDLNGDITKDNNGMQYYLFPLQHAVDSAIASVESTRSPNSASNVTQLPPVVNNWMFTAQTEEQWNRKMVREVLILNIDVVSLAWLMAFIGLVFKLVSFMAKEREMEMSDLIESMMPNRKRWEPQAIRLTSTFWAFTLIYLPGWFLAAVFMKVGLLNHSSAAIPIITFLLAGMAMVSFSMLGASFFRRAHLSSILVAGIAIILAIMGQIKSKKMSNAAMAITSLLFTPMNMVNIVITCCRWEQADQVIDLSKSAPTTDDEQPQSTLPVFVLWIFFFIQIIAYPILAATVERMLWGTAASRSGRTISADPNSAAPPVVVSNATKVYKKDPFRTILLKLLRRYTEPVVAVDNLSLSALRGDIVMLVGSNGCGKTTTLGAIAGFHDLSSGHITVDGSGGIGICPQKNVLWNSLTVEEHVWIFNRLKTNGTRLSDTAADLETLIALCGLNEKRKTRAKYLSGGQKRKLQLLLMLIGDSRVCCVDEASGGLDPLSRRWIWDILLAERGRRTFILTTHFLDEAEYLADHMVIMSKGAVKAEGSVSELKNKLGNGYRLQIRTPRTDDRELATDEKFDRILSLPDSSSVISAIRELEAQGITNYQIAGPTIEEVFMKLATDKDAMHDELTTEDMHWDASRALPTSSPERDPKESDSQEMERRRQVGAVRQAVILFGKRLTVLRRNPLPILLALLLPIIAAVCLMGLMKKVVNPDCDLQIHEAWTSRPYLPYYDTMMLIGPSPLSNENVTFLLDTFPNTTFRNALNSSTASTLFQHVGSWDEFSSLTHQKFANISPGAFYLGDAVNPPTFSVRSSMYYGEGIMGVFMQNILNVLITGVKIAASIQNFDSSLPPDTSESLQFTFFFGLVMCLAPAMFSLYPTRERVKSVRAMEYSNGVRPLPLWIAYALFDTGIATTSAIVAMAIFATSMKNAWFGLGYLLVVLLLYGVAAVLLSYLVSKVTKSAFSSFVAAAGGQA
jgi:ATP-binding cassette, subfamily A (ABC1), member 3